MISDFSLNNHKFMDERIFAKAKLEESKKTNNLQFTISNFTNSFFVTVFKTFRPTAPGTRTHDSD